MKTKLAEGGFCKTTPCKVALVFRPTILDRKLPSRFTVEERLLAQHAGRPLSLSRFLLEPLGDLDRRVLAGERTRSR
jgi:hypothetical protein